MTIPIEMRLVEQWLLFELTALPNGKIEKDPRQAKHLLRNASKTNPATWCDYPTARGVLARLGPGWALGFALANGFVGFDGDGVRDPQSGEIDPTTLWYLHLLNTFTEISVSGSGVHAIATGGPLPPDGRKKKPFELYDQHMFVVTGNLLAGFPATVEHRPDEIAELHRQVFGADTGATGADMPTVDDLLKDVPDWLTSDPDAETFNPVFDVDDTGYRKLSDDDVLLRAATASNGDKFLRLWRGDLSDYGGDHSVADLALVSILIYWTQGDQEQADRLFRQSNLVRAKWTTRADYRRRTFAKAATV
jgi:putative DNA primase/helicase